MSTLSRWVLKYVDWTVCIDSYAKAQSAEYHDANTVFAAGYCCSSFVTNHVC